MQTELMERAFLCLTSIACCVGLSWLFVAFFLGKAKHRIEDNNDNPYDGNV